MTRKRDYQKYLKSPDWSAHRNEALARTSGFCQFCGEVASQVHHVQYPKRFGDEHPYSLVPVCERCHNLSHGVQEMKPLAEVQKMMELAPNGARLNYLLSDARVYASAQSWARALQVPNSMSKWFTSGLARVALLKKDLAGGDLERSYQETAVYRWHAVAEQLRVFDRSWHEHQYQSRPVEERRELQQFHENYERLVSWGYDLQEKALASTLNSQKSAPSAVTPELLLETLKQAVAPRLRAHDEKLIEHDVVIQELRDAVPVLRDPEEFISVRQAVIEQGLDQTLMPLYPKSSENISGLAGQLLTAKRTKTGASVISRVDGRSVSTEMNTYKRKAIYAVLSEILKNKQEGLQF